MNRLLAPLLLRIAEMLDENLLTVPDVDEETPAPYAHRPSDAGEA